MAKSPAWQRAEGKNPKGGLNAKGRASAKAQGMNLKPPVKNKFCVCGARSQAATTQKRSQLCFGLQRYAVLRWYFMETDIATIATNLFLPQML